MPDPPTAPSSGASAHPRPEPRPSPATGPTRERASPPEPSPRPEPASPPSKAAPGRRRSNRSNPFALYLRLFTIPGTVAFTIGNLVARLPMGMFTVSAVIMIAGARGSYALAGSVTATGLVATAVVGPWTARFIDRYGQAQVAVPAAVFAALGTVGLVVCVHAEAPDWTLFVCYAATATTPNTGGLSRARWDHLLKGDPAALHTANSFEQTADELCFLLGPMLAAFLCSALFPEAGSLIAAFLLVSGVLLFAAQRSTQPPAHRSAAAGAPLRARGMPTLLVAFLATGAVFGSLEVVTIAFADAQGHRSIAGVVLALQAAGSGVAGLLYGALRMTGAPERRLAGCAAAMTALMTLPLLAASLTGSLLALAGALLIAGMANAPTMVTGMTLVQRRTPRGRINEGMTLSVTALLAGVAAGSATGGWVVEHAPSAATGYTVPVAAAGTALLILLPGAIRKPAPAGEARG